MSPKITLAANFSRLRLRPPMRARSRLFPGPAMLFSLDHDRRRTALPDPSTTPRQRRGRSATRRTARCASRLSVALKYWSAAAHTQRRSGPRAAALIGEPAVLGRPTGRRSVARSFRPREHKPAASADHLPAPPHPATTPPNTLGGVERNERRGHALMRGERPNRPIDVAQWGVAQTQGKVSDDQ
jgi:hypothetical protein